MEDNIIVPNYQGAGPKKSYLPNLITIQYNYAANS